MNLLKSTFFVLTVAVIGVTGCGRDTYQNQNEQEAFNELSDTLNSERGAFSGANGLNNLGTKLNELFGQGKIKLPGFPMPSGIPRPSNFPFPSAIPWPSNFPKPTALPRPTNIPFPTALPWPSGIPRPTVLPIPTGLPTGANLQTALDELKKILEQIKAGNGTNANSLATALSGLSSTSSASEGVNQLIAALNQAKPQFSQLSSQYNQALTNLQTILPSVATQLSRLKKGG